MANKANSEEFLTKGLVQNAKRPFEAVPSRIIVVRHGERMDDMFPGWIQKSGITGTYQAYDLNMPLALPEINRPLAHYQGDTALTEMGSVLAQMVGRGLLVNKSIPDVVYSSPSLRCVQTANSVLKAVGKDVGVKIRIEPALFENTDVYATGKPRFASSSDLQMAGYNIDLDYVPTVEIDQIWSKTESTNEYCNRVQGFILMNTKKSLKSARPEGPVTLMVGHSSTIDLALGAFQKPIRRPRACEFVNNGLVYPYCSTVIFDRGGDQVWRYNEIALPPVSYANFSSKINREFARREHVNQAIQ